MVIKLGTTFLEIFKLNQPFFLAVWIGSLTCLPRRCTLGGKRFQLEFNLF